MNKLSYLYGMQIIVDNRITKEVRARKHKKRRIDKKWLKKYGYKHVPDNNKILHIGDSLYMTQKCYDKIKNQLEVKEGVDNAKRFD